MIVVWGKGFFSVRKDAGRPHDQVGLEGGIEVEKGSSSSVRVSASWGFQPGESRAGGCGGLARLGEPFLLPLAAFRPPKPRELL